jgi:ketosteroid isomerase-like protein/rhodanese-related sulfurtransferase
MSEQNVQRTRTAYEALDRRDLDAFLEMIDPDVEFTSRALPSESDPNYRGHDGIRRWWRHLLAVFPDFSIEILEVRDLGERTIFRAEVRARDAGTDPPLGQEIWQANEWRNGQLVWWHTFDTEAEALEVARLLESAEEGSHVVARSLKPEAAWGAVRLGFAEVLDLRTGIERRRLGAPPGARHVSLAKHIISPEGPGAIYLCQHAIRSKATLRNGAAEVAGGFAAWEEAGLPVEKVA